ncbi:MAG: sulfatase-like hydrolase/transferase [Tannerella sp.]|jgi:arylsulfatase A-like enzyme|nr:sulfatase-like hydrolase/transferase [Tannerella sp.]
MRKYNIYYYIILIIISFITPNMLHSSETAAKNKPNVIFIYASDFGKGLISAYGQKHFSTPNIDYLINNGVSFSNAYGGARSAPARASLLTGYNGCKKDKWRISGGGVYIREDTLYIHQNEDFINEYDILLPENEYYLPQVFRRAGYVTAQTGVLGMGNTSTRRQMERYGWDYYYGYLDQVRAEGYYPPFLFESGQIVMIKGNTRTDAGRGYEPENDAAYKYRWDMKGKKTCAPDLIMDKTLEFIRFFKDWPFFLLFDTQLLRGPVSIPQIDPEIASNDNLSQVEKEYASMVKLLDKQVGIILSEIKKLGLEENTIIVFSSDCGHEIHYNQQNKFDRPYKNLQTGEKFDNSYFKYYSDLAGDVFNGNMGLAGLKRSNLEGGIQTPLVFYGKGRWKKYVCNDVVAAYDFIATMADMLNVKQETKKDGISLLPLLLKNKKLPKRRHVIIASDEGPALISNEGWKLRYVRSHSRYELYNLRKDPQEKYDVIRRFPEKAKELESILLKECNGNLDNGIYY